MRNHLQQQCQTPLNGEFETGLIPLGGRWSRPTPSFPPGELPLHHRPHAACSRCSSSSVSTDSSTRACAGRIVTKPLSRRSLPPVQIFEGGHCIRKTNRVEVRQTLQLIGDVVINALEVTSLSVQGLFIKRYSQKSLQVCHPAHIDMKPVMLAL